MSRHADAHRRSQAAPPAIDVDLTTPPIHAARPSSGTEGFFQEPPRLTNPYDDDFSFQRVLKLFLPETIRTSIAPELSRFGALALDPEILRLNSDAENNPPKLEQYDSFGRPKNLLITAEGWRALTAIHHSEGLIALGYENRYGFYDRLHQHLKTFLWSPSSGGVTCPAAMQDGAAALLTRLLANPTVNNVNNETEQVLRSALTRLTSRDPTIAWTSGQWMTERPGGSDVRNTETLATFSPDTAPSPTISTASDGLPLGPWSITGFKWFSSATDANMSVLLAKTPGHSTPSLFFAPVRRTTSSLSTPQKQTYNGIHPHRLKPKLGTRSLPTAELILHDLRAHLLGAEGQGVKEISTVLNITRLHNAIGAVAAWSRALAVARAWSRVRSSGGRRLEQWPLHVKGLAGETVEYHVATLGAFWGVGLLGLSEHPAGSEGGKGRREEGEEGRGRLSPANGKDVLRLLRLVTPVLKAVTALKAIEGVRSRMEGMGGVGYIENVEVEINLAKLYRDTNVLSIWEGTTDVMGLDVVRVLKGRDGKEVLGGLKRWVETVSKEWKEEQLVVQARDLVKRRVEELTALVARDVEQVTYEARRLLELVFDIIGAVLVVEDALSDRNDRAMRMAERWMSARVERTQSSGWRECAAVDRQIVFGVDSTSSKL